MRTKRLLSIAIGVAALATASLASPSAQAVVGPSRLVSVRTVALPEQKLDRIIFEIDGPLPAEYSAEYVDSFEADGSGANIPVPGQAIVKVRMFSVNAHDDEGHPLVSRRAAYSLPNLMVAIQGGDFEGVGTYGLGLAVARPLSIYTRQNPTRVVVAIDTTFPRIPAKVWFQNEPNFNEGDEPYVTAVNRRVSAAAPAAAVLDRLFAGPTATERDHGLRLVRSKADDWSNLSISGGIARVRLRGNCDSGGSTFTIANEMMPTLRQFPTVDWVKIAGPGGGTENPTGNSDSIPVCLEP